MRSLAALLGAGLLGAGLLGACMHIDPSNPYDPDTPVEYRQPSSFIGRVLVVNEPTGFSYEVFEVTLRNTEFSDYEYLVPVATDGTFQFDGVLPGRYTILIDGRVQGERFVLPRTEVMLYTGEQLTYRTPLVVKPISQVPLADLP